MHLGSLPLLVSTLSLSFCCLNPFTNNPFTAQNPYCPSPPFFLPNTSSTAVLQMDSSPTSILLCPPIDLKKDTNAGGVVFDSSLLRKQTKIPREFIWPLSERPSTIKELDAPVVDLQGFFQGDEASTLRAAELIKTTCMTHGFFQVTNHHVDESLTQDAFDCMDEFFGLPLGCKLRAKRKPGSMWGYAGAHSDRFSSKLPWKETLSFAFHDAGPEHMVVDYFTSNLGKDFERMG